MSSSTRGHTRTKSAISSSMAEAPRRKTRSMVRDGISSSPRKGSLLSFVPRAAAMGEEPSGAELKRSTSRHLEMSDGLRAQDHTVDPRAEALRNSLNGRMPVTASRSAHRTQPSTTSSTLQHRTPLRTSQEQALPIHAVAEAHAHQNRAGNTPYKSSTSPERPSTMKRSNFMRSLSPTKTLTSPTKPVTITRPVQAGSISSHDRPASSHEPQRLSPSKQTSSQNQSQRLSPSKQPTWSYESQRLSPTRPIARSVSPVKSTIPERFQIPSRYNISPESKARLDRCEALGSDPPSSDPASSESSSRAAAPMTSTSPIRYHGVPIPPARTPSSLANLNRPLSAVHSPSESPTRADQQRLPVSAAHHFSEDEFGEEAEEEEEEEEDDSIVMLKASPSRPPPLTTPAARRERLAQHTSAAPASFSTSPTKASNTSSTALQRGNSWKRQEATRVELPAPRPEPVKRPSWEERRAERIAANRSRQEEEGSSSISISSSASTKLLESRTSRRKRLEGMPNMSPVAEASPLKGAEPAPVPVRDTAPYKKCQRSPLDTSASVQDSSYTAAAGRQEPMDPPRLPGRKRSIDSVAPSSESATAGNSSTMNISTSTSHNRIASFSASRKASITGISNSGSSRLMNLGSWNLSEAASSALDRLEKRMEDGKESAAGSSGPRRPTGPPVNGAPSVQPGMRRSASAQVGSSSSSSSRGHSHSYDQSNSSGVAVAQGADASAKDVRLTPSKSDEVRSARRRTLAFLTRPDPTATIGELDDIERLAQEALQKHVDGRGGEETAVQRAAMRAEKAARRRSMRGYVPTKREESSSDASRDEHNMSIVGNITNGGAGTSSSVQVSAVVAHQRDRRTRPLRGLVILVDVRDQDGLDASGTWVEMLKAAGAKVLVRAPTTGAGGSAGNERRLTHIVYKSGRPATLHAFRAAPDPKPFVVGVQWVVKCTEAGAKVDEHPYLIEIGKQAVFQKVSTSKKVQAISRLIGCMLEQKRVNMAPRAAPTTAAAAAAATNGSTASTFSTNSTASNSATASGRTTIAAKGRTALAGQGTKAAGPLPSAAGRNKIGGVSTAPEAPATATAEEIDRARRKSLLHAPAAPSPLGLRVSHVDDTCLSSELSDEEDEEHDAERGEAKVEDDVLPVRRGQTVRR